MQVKELQLRIFVTLCSFCTFISGVPLKLFYPFGTDVGDTVLTKGDDISSDEVFLTVPIVFYDQRYSSIYVSMQRYYS